MRVRFCTDVSLHDGHHQAGDEVSLPDDVAVRLVGLGLCEAVEDPKPEGVLDVEAATLAEAPERAVVPRAKKRG